MKRQADRSRKEVEKYRVGNKVLISTKDFSKELMKRATKKLMEKFIGPYVVKKVVSENAVELELPAMLRIHPVVNVRRLVKYRRRVLEPLWRIFLSCFYRLSELFGSFFIEIFDCLKTFAR